MTATSSDGFVSDLIFITPEQEARERAEGERIQALLRKPIERAVRLMLPERPIARPDCCHAARTTFLVQWGNPVSFGANEEVRFGQAGWVIDGPHTNADETLVERHAVKFCPFCGGRLVRGLDAYELYMRAMIAWLREVRAISVELYEVEKHRWSREFRGRAVRDLLNLCKKQIEEST